MPRSFDGSKPAAPLRWLKLHTADARDNRTVSDRQPLPDRGLSSREAAERLTHEGPNLLPGSAPHKLTALALEVVAEPMFLMLLGAGGIYLALGDPAEALFLLAFVVAVIALTLVQQRRTQHALDSLRELSAPRAMIVRDGATQRIAAREIVKGDVLILCEGDRVAADARLVRGEIGLDESLLTGESTPVTRRPATRPAPAGTAPSDPPPAASSADEVVSAGTVVTRGSARAIVVATGPQTAMGRIGAGLANTVEPMSPLQRTARRVIRWLGLSALAIASLQVLISWWAGQALLQSLLAGLALAMAILPEEIPVILTIFLALGAWRIARRDVLTRRISAVEALGAITVLAVDKTGTLTENRMAVATLWTLERRVDLCDGALPDEHFKRLIESAMLASRDELFDPTERALHNLAVIAMPGSAALRSALSPLTEFPLTSSFPAMTRVYRSAQDGDLLFHSKGAPETMAELCGLDETSRALIHARVETLAAAGLRVLAVARGRQSADTAVPSDHRLPQAEFLGLVGLADPPRDAVSAALARCRAAGVRVIMMTGDHRATARAIARKVGLSDRDGVVDGSTVDAMSKEELAQHLRSADIWARLRPEHKLRLVQALQQAGELVAMTGDGVNDAPALKAADVGIAMGARGTDVAREAAALVLLDDRFTSIVEAIAQGRSIYDNITRAIRFACAVHVPIIGLALGASLLGWPTLLSPAQIVLLELLIDPACAIVFEAEPQAETLMRRPPRKVEASPFDRSSWLAAGLQGAGLCALLLGAAGVLMSHGWPVAEVRTVAFGGLVLSVVMLIVANRSFPSATEAGHAAANPWLWPVCAGVPGLLMLTMSVDGLAALLGIAPLSAKTFAALLLVALAGGMWLTPLRYLQRRQELSTDRINSASRQERSA